MFRVVTPDNMHRRGDRVWLVQHGIGASNCQFADDLRVYHVPEIQKPGDPLFPGTLAAHQQVIVVGIIVNDAVAETFEPGQKIGFKVIEPALNHRPSGTLWDVGKKIARPGGPCEIPFKGAAIRGVRETAKCSIHTAEQLAQAREHSRRMRPELGPDLSRSE